LRAAITKIVIEMSKTSRSHSELNRRDHVGDLDIDENMVLKYVWINQLQNSVLIFRVSLNRLQKYVEAFVMNYIKVFGKHRLKRGTVITSSFLRNSHFFYKELLS
jgi:hypothetical protein